MENQKNSYPVNRYRKTSGKQRNKYLFEFCGGDTCRSDGQNQGDPIRRKITIYPGAIDPLTGMEITIDMIRSWHRMDDVECDKNNEVIHTECEKEYRARKEEEKARIMEQLREELQREPTSSEIKYAMNEIPDRYTALSYERQLGDDPEQPGFESEAPDTAEPPELLRSDDVDAMEECVSKLPENLQRIYRLTLENIGGGAGRKSRVEMALELNIPETTYRRWEKWLWDAIRKAVEEARRQRMQEME